MAFGVSTAFGTSAIGAATTSFGAVFVASAVIGASIIIVESTTFEWAGLTFISFIIAGTETAVLLSSLTKVASFCRETWRSTARRESVPPLPVAFAMPAFKSGFS